MKDTSIFIIPDERMIIQNDDTDFTVLQDNLDIVITAPASGVRGSRIVEIGASIQGIVYPNEIILRHHLANPLLVIPDMCKASCDNRPLTSVAFNIELDNIAIGYVTFVASSNDGVFTFPSLTGPIGPGILRFVAPAVTSNIADLSITLTGDR